MSVALVNPQGHRPARLTGVAARLVGTPHEIRAGDDVVLFYGAGMGHRVRHFAAAAEGELPPVMVLAPRLDWNDVALALDHGAASYLIENRYAFPLAETLVCASRGASILDPEIAAERVGAACRSRADEATRDRPGRATAPRDGSDAEAPAREAPGAEQIPPVSPLPHPPGPILPPPSCLPHLSLRERQLMDLLAAGLGVREVAEAMSLTDKTVRNYLSRVYTKLGVHRQSEAILYWLGHLATRDAARTPADPDAC
ncbi:LuxR C-terminal-related transcriptional regulator [Streptomyces sp. NPDC087212]|uniref:helix-turn-helix transcriptional regulator n=1 Tax=Streptomyces sp. NPDC087212 TaxID=3365766 RepID=UPI0037F32A3D